VVTLVLTLPMLVKAMPVSMPQSKLDGAPRLQRSLVVSLDAQKRLTLHGELASIDAIKHRIVKGQTTVELAVDGAVRYADLAATVDALRDAEPAEINLLTR